MHGFLQFRWSYKKKNLYSLLNFECSEINVVVLPNRQFYIRNLMLNTIIQIVLIKSSSILSTLFHLIDLDLRCSTSKLIGLLSSWNNLFSKASILQGKNAGFIWFGFYCIWLWIYMVQFLLGLRSTKHY